MYKIAVMGDYDSIYGFQSIGLTLLATDGLSNEEARRMLRTAAQSEFGIIYMTEELLERLSDEIQLYNEKLTPAIIAIPGVKGNSGIGIINVKKSVEQAVGSDILFAGDTRS